MSDIFREVDEEVRREQLQKLWERYQNLVFAGIFLILPVSAAGAATSGRTRSARREPAPPSKPRRCSSDEGKHAEAESAYAKIAAEGTASYRDLARVRQAAELAEQRSKAAIAAYAKIADDGSVRSGWRDLAGLRAGSLLHRRGLLQRGPSRLEPLAREGRPYRYTARELLALGAWRAGDTAGPSAGPTSSSRTSRRPPATRPRSRC